MIALDEAGVIPPHQQFHRGDLVRIAKDLGPSMAHFPCDQDAIVTGSYADQYGGTNRHDFTVFLRGIGESSWYRAGQLSLLERGRLALLEEWAAEISAEALQKGDLDWIFGHGAEVLEGAHGATIQALASCLGIENLWGPHGEGIVYYQNAMTVLTHAKPFLEGGDKTGWLAYCAEQGRGGADAG